MIEDPEIATAAIASGYEVIGGALEPGTVVVDGIADPDAQVRIPLAGLTRHVLVAGADRTATLQVLAEQLSAAGIPVVVAGAATDLSGLSASGDPTDDVLTRAGDTGDESWTPTGYPVACYSLGAEGTGIPVRVTVTSFGPVLLAKALGLDTDAEAALTQVFRGADRHGHPLLDLADLRRAVIYAEEDGADLTPETADVLLDAIDDLENAGGGGCFGEPEIEVEDLLRVADGHGTIDLIEVGGSIRPALSSVFPLWLLADLIHTLPEVGEVDEPRLVFVFDEAHLLFADASETFLHEIEETLDLLSSRGVGVVFATGAPTEVPDPVLDRLGTRLLHALPDPADEAVFAKAVGLYPESDVYEIAETIRSLGPGEALVTAMSEIGTPTPVAWTRIRAPRSRRGTVGESAMRASAQANPLYGKYGRPIDRESAYAKLTASVVGPTDEEPTETPSEAGQEIERNLFGIGRRRRR